ncbi:MAG: DEAD/DEAH box helicase family protein [Spirochaetaceae bacterium]|jgi:type III restriction enzyme|nr:DEAD/DEAH box helicase family protein [Spirochaetaceae bacterium]
MQLKSYQQNTLNVIRAFFETCAGASPRDAYYSIVAKPEVAERLGKIHRGYTQVPELANTPKICLKVPTGGGKTILAAHSIKIAAETGISKENPVVLWFVPTETIRKQTAEALKNAMHPYREVLNEQFDGKIAIFDIDEKSTIRPADINEKTCIIISTIQSFVKKDTSKYNVYKDDENLEDHFRALIAKHNGKIPSSAVAGMEMRETENRPKYSFANLLHYHKPLMIIDEAHKVLTELSVETQIRLNPSAIIEWTATPRLKDGALYNNVLYSVRADELKKEEMIKLPIVLVEHTGWENAVQAAVARLAELEKICAKENEYIRPLLLFQAQNKNQEVNVTALKKHLLEIIDIPENEIKIVTGEQKELDDINIFNPSEKTRYIITVDALKEGWDCSFAYVLCSLANIKSDTTVEQLLGRVMRLPNAKSLKNPALNKAYAYVISQKFGEAAAALTEKLIEKGFDSDDAKFNIIVEHPELFDAVPQITPAAITSPASSGELWIIPRLKFESRHGSGEFYFAESENIFSEFDWNIADYSTPRLEPQEFNVEELPGKNFIIDIDGKNLKYSLSADEDAYYHFSEVENWTAANLVLWLDKTLKQEDIPQTQMVEWLRKHIEYLTEIRGIHLTALFLAKYALRTKLAGKIDDARKKAKIESFDLFKRETRKMIDFENGFEFKDGMYDGEKPYTGMFKFNKHFLSFVPEIGGGDGGDGGEEFQCAQALDAEPQIQYWLRNIARHPASFRLATSSGNFYPDFAAKLKDGRTLIVEYKGGHLLNNQDTKEKALIGNIWEKESHGKILFIMCVKSKNGFSVAEQIKEKIAKI